MKQVLSQNIGLIGNDWIIEHPTMIFTNDDVPVEVFTTVEELNYAIAQKDVTKFPPLPAIGEWCEKGIVYSYGTDKAKCLQGHYRMQFPLEDIPALFTIIKTVSTYPVWKQPTGAHDAYKKGDKVYFPTANDSLYESLIDANVWSPTAYPAGWKKL